ALAVNTTGTTTFGGAVGSTGRLISLTTNAGGQTNINGGSVNTQTTQNYGDNVLLTSPAASHLTTLTGTAITFGGTLGGSASDVEVLRVVASGGVTFTGNVGAGTQKLHTLTVDAGGTVDATGASASIVATNLQLRGVGPFNLTNVSNNVATFAVISTGAVN